VSKGRRARTKTLTDAQLAAAIEERQKKRIAAVREGLLALERKHRVGVVAQPIPAQVTRLGVLAVNGICAYVPFEELPDGGASYSTEGDSDAG
jgi:uncharacterized membrane protein YecN with MAPEG domain